MPKHGLLDCYNRIEPDLKNQLIDASGEKHYHYKVRLGTCEAQLCGST